MGAEGSQTDQSSTIDLFRAYIDGEPPSELSQLCSNGTTYKVWALEFLSLAVAHTKCRLAHRLRDMQTLPFVVVTNPHMSHVYNLYYKAFETLRRVGEIKSVEDNEQYCKIISETLQEHLTVIPRLAMGVLECQDLMRPEEMDKFMNTLLRSVGSLKLQHAKR